MYIQLYIVYYQLHVHYVTCTLCHIYLHVNMHVITTCTYQHMEMYNVTYMYIVVQYIVSSQCRIIII